MSDEASESPFPIWDERNSDGDRLLERAKVQAYLNRIERRSSDQEESPNQPVRQLERNGELLWVLGDGSRHERRIQRAVPSEQDRLFWATLAVACGRPGSLTGDAEQQQTTLAKEFGVLAKSRHDLDAFYEYYRPIQLGDPRIVGVPPGLGKSPGYFDRAIRLDNPTVAQLQYAVQKLSEWVKVNQEDPEYTSFQLNFCFSGHGTRNGGGDTGIVLADAELSATALGTLLLASVPENEAKPSLCRLDLFLDCCHSAGVARSLVRHLSLSQAGRDPVDRSVLSMGQAYCACLDDEEAFELGQLSHSIFTFAFLNECSRRRPEGADRANVGLRDIGWFTEGQQHPLLLDLTSDEGIAVKFPSSFYVTYSPAARAHWQAVAGMAAGLEHDTCDPLAQPLQLARAQRAACREVEYEWATRPDARKPFSRDEVLTNRRFPFV